MQKSRARGRGTVSNSGGRYEKLARAEIDDGWESSDAELPVLKTTVAKDTSRTIITRNASADISFDRSINPYRGCEHGCVYCYARPTHAYLGLSPGLDFETRLFVKPEAPILLENELNNPRYRPRPIALGTNTDPYQPIEKGYRVMRGILQVLERYNHPLTIVTKSALILRDLDILSAMAARRLVAVGISVTTLDRKLARTMEPRAATPGRRLEAIAGLAAAGVPVRVMAAPMIPGLNDSELESILEAAAKAGARNASYIILRMPLEIKDLFREWLKTHAPDRAARVISLMKQMRGGRDYDPEWNRRMTGSGPVAEILARRFAIAVKRLGLNTEEFPLDCSGFSPPRVNDPQLSLFTA